MVGCSTIRMGGRSRGRTFPHEISSNSSTIDIIQLGLYFQYLGLTKFIIFFTNSGSDSGYKLLVLG
jgi:hypothetical protein